MRQHSQFQFWKRDSKSYKWKNQVHKEAYQHEDWSYQEKEQAHASQWIVSIPEFRASDLLKQGQLNRNWIYSNPVYFLDYDISD